MNFHIHTTHSDGGKTVTQIIAGLKEVGVNCFSITDHDCVKGNIEAAELAKQNGLTHINGVELSCCFCGEIGFDATYVCHIVGLDIDIKKMQTELDKIIAAKDAKMAELFEELVADGYKLDRNKVYEDGRIKERKVIGYELVRAGYAVENNEAFSKILNSDKYRKYAENLPTIKEGIAIIHACGGLAVWAHPFGIAHGGKKELTKEQVTELSKKMLDYGIDAVEAYYQEYTAEQIRFLEELADEMKLPKSIATDFHGVDPAKEKDPEYMGKVIQEQLFFEKEGITPNADVKKIIVKRRLEQIEREIEEVKDFRYGWGKYGSEMCDSALNALYEEKMELKKEMEQTGY